jgi:protein-disulfide isomerase
MPVASPRKKSKPLSPYLHLFIPVAFFIGLAAGYLLWGVPAAGTSAGNPAIQRVDASTDDDPAIGPEDAPVTIIEFGDYQCGYCRLWYQQTFNQLMATYPDQIRFVYRDMTNSGHPESLPAAEAANCAGEQGGYWQFHNALFSGEYELGRDGYEQYAADLGLDLASFTTCLDDNRYQDEINADGADAARLGISGTPSFVINGRILVGAQEFAAFKAIIDEELAGK